MSQYKVLTPEQVDHFMNYGYVIIKGAFEKEQAAEWLKHVWVRLDMDPNDNGTWHTERIHMPWHHRVPVSEFSPKAWGAMCDLLGEDRIDANASTWGDSFIINFGTEALAKADKYIEPRDLDNWHVDGDFFVHFLDSPEQALLVIPIFSDIKPRGGGTFIAPGSIERVAKYLHSHPEGVLPRNLTFVPSTSTYEDGSQDPGCWSHLHEVKKLSEFVEVTGEVGDVVLLHPLMMHSASKNYLRVPRIITNPPVGLKEPFKFSRADDAEYSLVEKKTLKALGLDRSDFEITSQRGRVKPGRAPAQERMREEEKKRMELAKANEISVLS